MNLNYQIGNFLNTVIHGALSATWFPLTRYVPRGQYWMYDIQRYFKRREFGVIFDVGANTGQTASDLVRYFRGAEIYCFEPVKQTFDILNATYGSKVHCEHVALGATAGTKWIHLHTDSELNSFVTTRASAKRNGNELVTVKTIDGICLEKGIREIEILKIDVQGWEMEVLKGADSMLRQRTIRVICSEVAFRTRDTDMQEFDSLNRHLDALGYEFCGLYDHFRWGPSKIFLGFANALYVLPLKKGP